jgi:hypothetical protein
VLLPDSVKILLSHNPNTFDRAARLGIDLSLSGHTHGGQVAVEFKGCSLAGERLITPYIRGWFQKGDAQLYVNRGIGTITFPIRITAGDHCFRTEPSESYLGKINILVLGLKSQSVASAVPESFWKKHRHDLTMGRDALI